MKSKIGTAVTVKDRDLGAVEKIAKLAPGPLVIVDDASVQPYRFATFRFDEGVGIARAKNKCIELLLAQGCEHAFLFDDDCFPLVPDWYEYYIQCNTHMSYTFDREIIGHTVIHTTPDDLMGINVYAQPNGCMIYLPKYCIDKVGGFDTAYSNGYGYEHVDLSQRIHNAGLTEYPFMDFVCNNMFYSHDQHGTCRPSTTGRRAASNKQLYLDNINSVEYKPYK